MLSEDNSVNNSDSQDIKELDFNVFNVLKDIFGDNFYNAIDNHTKSAKENILRIETAITNNNASELEHAAHSLKGASAQFGAMVLSDWAKKMEAYGKNNEVNKAKDILQEIIVARENAEKAMLNEIG